MFMNWVDPHQRSLDDAKRSATLSEYLDVLMQDGVMSGEGRKVVAAFVKMSAGLQRTELVVALETL